MRFLLDTNAVSEPQRPRPDHGYLSWVGAQDSDDLAISALTFGELRRGISALGAGHQRTALSAWLATGLAVFADRVLPVDVQVAEAWGELSARLKREGRVIGTVDELVAATARAHGLIVVTRNRRHFEMAECEVITPWSTV